MSIYSEWLVAKETERQAVEKRRSLEDQLVKDLAFDLQKDGTENYDCGRYAVKVVGRIDRKIDSDKLQAIAAENGLSAHLSSLFRWKPEINMSAWKAADESITRPLADAITAKPGRPSFSITIKE